MYYRLGIGGSSRGLPTFKILSRNLIKQLPIYLIPLEMFPQSQVALMKMNFKSNKRNHASESVTQHDTGTDEVRRNGGRG